MRLWFCSPGCREAADDTPRPWPFPLREGICPICHAPRPAESAYLIARASIDAGYDAFTAHPLIQVGTYQIVEVDSAWRVAACEHLASGLQLRTVEIFDTAETAAAAVLELSQRRPFQRPTWPLVVRRLRRWQIELSHTTEGDGPADGVGFTLLSRSGKRGFVSVVAVVTYNGIRVHITNARQVEIPWIEDGWNSFPKSYTTCRNFQFGVHHFGYDGTTRPTQPEFTNPRNGRSREALQRRARRRKRP